MPDKTPKFGSHEAPFNEGMTSTPPKSGNKQPQQHSEEKEINTRGGSERASDNSSRKSTQEPSSASKKDTRKLLAIFGGLAFLIFLIFSSTEKKEAKWAAPAAPEPPAALATAPAYPYPLLEAVPTSKTTKTLTYQELAFCLAEGIRLDAAIEVPNKTNFVEFKKRLTRYNEECPNASYYIDDMKRAEPHINAYRSMYIAEGESLARLTEETFVSVFFTNERNGGGFGKGKTIDAAKGAALRSCNAKYPNSVCVERISGAGRCLAVANDATGMKASAGIGETSSIAESNALQACKLNNQNCSIPTNQSICDIN